LRLANYYTSHLHRFAWAHGKRILRKAPLVEIVAELRWTPPDIALSQQPAPNTVTFTTATPVSLDQLFHTFTGEIYQRDFGQVERLVPAGFPIVLHQPAFRFRSHKKASALLQLGLGLFTANGLQPYHSWDDFGPLAEQGVNALIKARVPNDQVNPFTLHNLRYINVFNAELLNGQSVPEFITRTLGLSIQLPAAFDAVVDAPLSVKPHLQLAIPIKATNKTMGLNLGEGTLPPSITRALLMEISVTEPSIKPNAAEIMAAFDSSREIIHTTFVRMTEKIHQLMKPRQAS
jgi:uncharacterized protein (TIGR04255 family)